MNKLYITILSLVMGILPCFAQEEIQTHKVKVGDFTTLKVCDHINVVYSTNPDSLGYAQFKAPVSLVNSVLFENNGKGTLAVRIETDDKDVSKLPTIYVYSRFLYEARNEADGTLKIMNCSPVSEIKLETLANGKLIANGIDATKLSAAISTGKGLIIAKGKSDNANYKLIGTGEIQADELITGDVQCKLLGTGTIGCNVNGILKIKGSGTGKVYYTGKPTKIKKSTLGPIKAISLDNPEDNEASEEDKK